MSTLRGDIEEAKGSVDLDEINYPETEMLKERLEWFQDLKLGVIFHYGLYAQAGIVESWQLSEKDEWAREGRAFRQDFKQLQLDYWNLISEFNPTKIDTDKWAETCKAAGIKYCIFTTKHHDGFNMYNTMETEYKIGGKLSPFKRDIFKEVSNSFRNVGISMGAYYSKADWYSPFYWLDQDTKNGRTVNYDPIQYPEIWKRYVNFVHHQIWELTHNYGKVDLLWLDAGWCGQKKEDLQMDRLAEIARDGQPDLLIVDRMMGGRHENYVTPERKIPKYSEIPLKPWESNIPIGNDWGYVPNDQFKSSQELLEMLVDVVSKGGNLILGVGPTPEGTFTEEEDKILNEIGRWLEVYGEGIYHTRANLKDDSEHDWKFTYHKNQEQYYAFRSISIQDNVIPLEEIGAKSLDHIEDLATGKTVKIRTFEGKSCIYMEDISQPELGLIGLSICTHS